MSEKTFIPFYISFHFFSFVIVFCLFFSFFVLLQCEYVFHQQAQQQEEKRCSRQSFPGILYYLNIVQVFLPLKQQVF